MKNIYSEFCKLVMKNSVYSEKMHVNAHYKWASAVQILGTGIPCIHR